MKRSVMVVALAMALFATSVAPALAASTQKYTLVLPRFGGSYYTSTKTLSVYRDIGVKHLYSGGKSVNFQVCDSQKNAVGPRVTVAPGGATAPLTDLWYNSSASAKTVRVRMWTSLTTVVEVLAQGTWYWNY